MDCLKDTRLKMVENWISKIQKLNKNIKNCIKEVKVTVAKVFNLKIIDDTLKEIWVNFAIFETKNLITGAFKK